MADHYIRAAMLRLFTYGLHIAPWLLTAFALAYLTLRLRDRRRPKAPGRVYAESDNRLSFICGRMALIHLFSSTGWLGSRLQRLWFHLRASRWRLRRGLVKLLQAQPPRLRRGFTAMPGSVTGRVLASSTTPLWTAATHDDWHLVAGKVQNLRVATARLHGLRVPAEKVFSFWGALGRPGAGRGYARGRELREGCLIASVGGGLCQLSNALYALALEAGMDIVERHAHSRVVPGSAAEQGRDATVFWNYVDLRFRARQPFTIAAYLHADELVVQLLADADALVPAPTATRKIMPIVNADGGEVADCARCEHSACVSHIEPPPGVVGECYLLDEVLPEFDRWLIRQPAGAVTALVPLDGQRRGRAAYGWTLLRQPQVRAKEMLWLTLRRALASRRLQSQGAARQRQLLAFEQKLAQAYVRALPHTAARLTVALSLLPHLAASGALGGRRVTVLLNRAPLAMLHAGLDRAANLHPQSPTLRDFRADIGLLAWEDWGLSQAARLITPHRGVAAYVREQYRAEVLLLDWQPVPAPIWQAGRRVLFPASALARKGALEVRAACRELGLEVSVLGVAMENDDFWHDVPVHRVTAATAFEQVACVLLPAFVEHRPRLLLAAVAAGMPVVCSLECGLPEACPSVTIVPAGDVAAIVRALIQLGCGASRQ